MYFQEVHPKKIIFVYSPQFLKWQKLNLELYKYLDQLPVAEGKVTNDLLIGYCSLYFVVLL